MTGWKLPRLFSSEDGATTSRSLPKRLRIGIEGVATYAVGDVHGCLDELLALEKLMIDDAAKFAGEKLIVMLGDYVDRGPRSADVLEHLSNPAPANFHRLCLLGNHERFMLDYLDDRITLADWLTVGGLPTILSYGVEPAVVQALNSDPASVDAKVRAAIPAHHVDLLRAMPILIDTGHYLFVHAGIRPGIPIDDQRDEDLLFIRSSFFEVSDRLPRYVVHGHTPIEKAERIGRRVNLDTGAFKTGRLSALRIWQNRGRFLSNMH
ncbi:serine/threonine protein phosphatase [Aliihoeflea aestuarii]|jgi:serine/threonine protein phosphatase 1|uniref:metallophosphoesterase family protein n=1 Tax=Aliihoeflea aestuarii TaxID=453840 RepID=UPI0020957E30|nr:metallophosphoesterase family protein [Aliihoeflea aestuarii]MCO6392596.1 serine/threonine protein phosphatase [Aliihoeflea aestuarii]